MLKKIATNEKAELLWSFFRQGDADAYGAILGRYYMIYLITENGFLPARNL